MQKSAHKDTIAVLDFGSQYSHLIVRRIRELGVYAELLAPEVSAEKLAKYKAIVLSGGPQNLSESTALKADPKVYTLGVPILGVCYGLQLLAHQLGGKVTAGKKREYGPVRVELSSKSELFRGMKTTEHPFASQTRHFPSKEGQMGERKEEGELTWMSHGDQVTKIPKGFVVTGKSGACPIAAIEDTKRKIYGIQFHPEVKHTSNGMKVIENFLKIVGAKKSWSMGKDWIASQVADIKTKVGKGRALCALSGGVDSTVAAYLVHRAIGKQLTCIYVDTGLMRQGETEQIKKTFAKLPELDFRAVDAENEFLDALRGVTEPEKKRKIIGELFIRLFERETGKNSHQPAKRNTTTPASGHPSSTEEGKTAFDFLVQGTLYTDAITSGVSVGGKAAVIKSHHNVGGLPKDVKFKLIEPLRDLYKDEVRALGRALGVPEKIASRQPFPGPGLAVRVIGAVSKEKLVMLRAADAIFCEEIEKAGLQKDIQQYLAVLPDIRSVGVQGDARTYGHPIILRAVTTADFMTADWARIPHELLAKVSARITNEVAGINRVAYDITSKPPGTVEWE
ncbi:MAG: glutamine-hydrolyzing GMP synthase [Candidatus Taylorbacteria bacterium]|nr:glutamine-hydrolyzing GMP synthase [Candidatus Taylorbacteria bacterium]